eukprot:5480840-Alexandrium_andersonii.AAC.1
MWCARCNKGAHAVRGLRSQACGAMKAGVPLREARASSWQRRNQLGAWHQAGEGNRTELKEALQACFESQPSAEWRGVVSDMAAHDALNQYK